MCNKITNKAKQSETIVRHAFRYLVQNEINLSVMSVDHTSLQPIEVKAYNLNWKNKKKKLMLSEMHILSLAFKLMVSLCQYRTDRSSPILIAHVELLIHSLILNNNIYLYSQYLSLSILDWRDFELGRTSLHL